MRAVPEAEAHELIRKHEKAAGNIFHSRRLFQTLPSNLDCLRIFRSTPVVDLEKKSIFENIKIKSIF